MQGSPAVIRVLLADDDTTFVEFLRRLIDQQPELTVVGTAHDGLAAIELAENVMPDAVVMDLHIAAARRRQRGRTAAPRRAASLPDRADRRRRPGAPPRRLGGGSRRR